MHMKYLKIAYFFIFISFISVGQSTQELLKQANEKEEKALYEEANQILEQLISQTKASKDWQNYMLARTQKAHNLLKSNKLEASLDWINQNLNELENPEIEKAFFWKMKNNLLTAEVLLAFGQYEKVKNTLKIIVEQLEKEKEESLLADSYNLLGILYWQEGNNSLALSYLEKSLSLREKNALAVQIAASYNDLGLVYQRTDPQKALSFYQKAFSIYQQTYPENHPKIAVAYANIGLAQKLLKEYTEAEKAFKKALNIWKNIYPEGHPNEAFNLNNLGSLALQEKKYEAAITYHKQALSSYQKFYKERHPEIASTYNLIAAAFLANSDFKQALYHAHLAIVNNTLNFRNEDTSQNPAVSEVLSYNVFLYSLFLKSDILEQRYVSQSIRLKDLKAALSAVSTADTLLDKIRQNANNQADKLFLGQISAQLYEKGIRLCYLLANEAQQAKKYYPQAFYFSEKSKAIVLLEAISESKAKEFGNIPQELLKEEADLKAKITFLEQQIALKPEESLLKKYKNELFELNRRYEAFQKNLEKQYQSYYNLKYSSATASLPQIQNQLDEKTALISYTVGEQHIYIFTITKKSVFLESRTKRADFEDDITFLLNAIRFSSYKPFSKMAYQLYQELFPSKNLAQIKNLVIIQDGKLSVLPMEVLLRKKVSKQDASNDFSKLPYLFLEKSVCYAYSATLWYQNISKNQQSEPKIALIAPVSFAGNISKLPATEQEVNEIAKICRQKKFKISTLLKDEAQEAILKKLNLKDFSILHFATHGLVDEENPELSQVFLGANEQEDGNLFAGEIFNLPLNADLVTLSACEVGLGKLTKGEGLIGLSRAFLYAGAKNLVVSLWKVSDESTAKLMIYFYTSHFEASNKTYAQAMREAKLQLLKDKNYAKPYYWAAFVVLGSD